MPAELNQEEIIAALKEPVFELASDEANDYETEPDMEEIETKSRSGFIPFTDGGWTAKWFTYLPYHESTGYGFPTKSLNTFFQNQLAQAYEGAQKWFAEKYPEIVEELGAENIGYSELEEAGYIQEAEEFNEAYNEWLQDESAMWEVQAIYYDPENGQNPAKGKHSIVVQGVINMEAPYHRSGNFEDFIEEAFQFDTMEELDRGLQTALGKVKNWFEGGGEGRELKFRRW